MTNVIEIKDLSCLKIINNLSIEIKRNRWLTIVGPNGSGKTLFAKCLAKIIPYEGTINIYGKEKIGIVFSHSDLNFILNTVDEELTFNKNIVDNDIDEFNNYKEKIIMNLGLKKVLSINPTELSNSYKVLVSLASVLIYKPEILILDGTIDVLDKVQKEKVIKLLNGLKRKGVTIINISQDIENSLLGDDIMLMYDGEIKLYDVKSKFFKDEKILKKYGLNLPFVVSLSNKLKYYDITDKMYLDMEELVDAVWQ